MKFKVTKRLSFFLFIKDYLQGNFLRLLFIATGIMLSVSLIFLSIVIPQNYLYAEIQSNLGDSSPIASISGNIDIDKLENDHYTKLYNFFEQQFKKFEFPVQNSTFYSVIQFSTTKLQITKTSTNTTIQHPLQLIIIKDELTEKAASPIYTDSLKNYLSGTSFILIAPEIVLTTYSLEKAGVSLKFSPINFPLNVIRRFSTEDLRQVIIRTNPQLEYRWDEFLTTFEISFIPTQTDNLTTVPITLMTTFSTFMEMKKRSTGFQFDVKGREHIEFYGKINAYSFDLWNMEKEVLRFKQQEAQIFNNFISQFPSTLDEFTEIISLKTHSSSLVETELLHKSRLSLPTYQTIIMPLLLLSLMTGYFSFSLQRRQLVVQISIFKGRGATFLQIAITLLLEAITVGIIGGILGIAFSSFTLEILKTTKGLILTDYYTVAPKTFVITMSEVILALESGIILSLFVNAIPYLSLALKKIFFGNIPEVVHQEPFWKRKNIDIILLVYGIIGVIIFGLILKLNPNTGETTTTADLIKIISARLSVLGFFSLLIIPSPFFLAFGLSAFLARLYIVILNKVSYKAWKKWGGLKSFAIRDLYRHRKLSSHGVIIGTISITLIILTIILPIISIENIGYYSQYYTGSDIRITHSRTGSPATGFLTYLHTNYSNYISGTTAVFYWYDDESPQKISILGVNPDDFLDAAYIPNTLGLSKDMKQIMEEFSQNQNTILLWEKTRQQFHLQIGDTIEIRVLKNSRIIMSVLNLKIIGTFKYFPLLVSADLERSPTNYIVGVVNENLKTEFLKGTTLTFGYYYLIKAKNANAAKQLDTQLKIAYDDKILRQWLGTTFKKDDITFYLDRNQELQNFVFPSSMIALINLLVMYGGIVSLTILSFFSFLYLKERSLLTGIERALGMKKEQLFTLAFISNLIVLIFTLFLGTILGLSVTIGLIELLVNTFSLAPPPLFHVPFHLIAITDAIIFAGMIFSLIVAINITSRINIAAILRNE